MDATNKRHTVWEFPEEITFDLVSEYSTIFADITGPHVMTFDLSDTRTIHSSFIGFLIFVQHTMKRNDGKLNLKLSLMAERLLILLNVIDYFKPYEVEYGKATKTA